MIHETHHNLRDNTKVPLSPRSDESDFQKVRPISPREAKLVPNVLNLFCLAFEWTAILTLAWLGRTLLDFGGTIGFIGMCAVVFLIGSRQHALGILLHEASHYRLFSQKKWNDRVAQVFLATPALIDLKQYRIQHFSHHSYNQTAKDQQYSRKKDLWIFSYPKNKIEILSISFALACGLGVLQVFKDLRRTWKNKTSGKNSIWRKFFVTALVSSAIAGGWWLELLFFWVLPVLTVFPLLNYWRTVAEHIAIPDPTKLTRSLRLNPVAAWIFMPYNIHYHGEHHSEPSLPWILLPKKDISQSDVWETDGFADFFRECSSVRKT